MNRTSGADPQRDNYRRFSATVAICLAMIIAAAILDGWKPFGKGYSLCYFFPAIYAGWVLRGRIELAMYALIIFATYFVPIMKFSGPWTQFGYFNRSVGVLAGLLVAGLVRERRRYSDALHAINNELEQRVKERTTELSSINEEFRRVLNVRTQFLRNMSHEIRTPLNAIVGISSVLSETRLDAEQQELVRTLQLSGKTLIDLVNDILDLSRLEAGRIDLEKLPLLIPSIVADVAAIMRPEAVRKGLELTIQLPPDPLPTVIGDQLRLRQILLNLVGNAVKFTSSGFVRIEVAMLEMSASHCVLKINVQDSGTGITPEVRKRLFDIFTQGDPSTTRQYGGSGLGLAISKGLVELMNGTIGLDSQSGVGSNFWVMLPFALVEDLEPSANVAQSLTTARTNSSRAMVVEDNPINRRLTVRFLEKFGCVVHSAANGRDAINALTSETFDLIFMDCQMPEMDGFDATRAIRETEGRLHRHTPIIAITASVLPEDRKACFEAGMDDYIAKPVSIGDLQRVLDRWHPAHRL